MFAEIKPLEFLLIIAACLVMADVAYETLDGLAPVMRVLGRLLELVGRAISMIQN